MKHMKDLDYLEWLYKTEDEIASIFELHQTAREEKIIEEFVNYIGQMKKIVLPRLQLSFEAKFLHGHNSMVKFSFQNKSTERELCDLLIVTTLMDGHKFISQRVTFVQAKKGSKKTRRYSIDLAQLHLLSRFPKFEGTKGIFKNKKIQYKNLMESLGSYLLFSSNEEFSWCTASALKRELGLKKSIKYKDLNNLYSSEYRSFFKHFPLSPWGWQPYLPDGVESCSTLNRFLQAWSSYCLGEPWWIDEASKKSTNLDLTILVKHIARRAGLTSLTEAMSAIDTPDLDNMSDDENSFFVDGIISTIIDIKKEL